MNNIDEMIAVLEAYKRGEKIEYYSEAYDNWKTLDNPMWNFGNINYRIAPTKPKKVKLEAWLMPHGNLVWYDMNQVKVWSTDAVRVPSEDKEIDLP